MEFKTEGVFPQKKTLLHTRLPGGLENNNWIMFCWQVLLGGHLVLVFGARGDFGEFLLMWPRHILFPLKVWWLDPGGGEVTSGGENMNG